MIGMPKKRTKGFFLIQMSSCMLSINKTDLPPVINPFELLIIFFLLLSSDKGYTFFFHLIIWWLLLCCMKIQNF